MRCRSTCWATEGELLPCALCLCVLWGSSRHVGEQGSVVLRSEGDGTGDRVASLRVTPWYRDLQGKQAAEEG